MFGGAIRAGAIPYVDFLVPGFVATGVLFSGMGAAVAMAEDLQRRLRRPAALAADPAQLRARGPGDRRHRDPHLAPAVTVAIAFAVGFRLQAARRSTGSPPSGSCVVFGFAFEWLFIAIGPVRRQRPGRAGHGDDRVPAGLRLQRLRARRHDARLAAGLRQAPAADAHGRRRARAHARLAGASRCSATRPRTSSAGRCSGRPRSSPSSSRSPSPDTGAARPEKEKHHDTARPHVARRDPRQRGDRLPSLCILAVLLWQTFAIVVRDDRRTEREARQRQ